jgi:hypothetical protein
MLLMLAPIMAFATPDDTSHSQGNQFQCSTSPLQEIPCEIENILKFFFPQFLQQQQEIAGNMTKIISLQQEQIDLLTEQNKLLQKIIDNTTPAPAAIPSKPAIAPINIPSVNIPNCYMTHNGVKC